MPILHAVQPYVLLELDAYDICLILVPFITARILEHSSSVFGRVSETHGATEHTIVFWTSAALSHSHPWNVWLVFRTLMSVTRDLGRFFAGRLIRFRATYAICKVIYVSTTDVL